MMTERWASAAPGRAPPDGSVTAPSMLPVVWAKAGAAKPGRSTRATAKAERTIAEGNVICVGPPSSFEYTRRLPKAPAELASAPAVRLEGILLYPRPGVKR